jgi:hypothetical protein
LAIEFVRTRRVVRLLGWTPEVVIEPVEVPIDVLCRELGIGPRDVGAPVRFLLFAGPHQRPLGGLHDLVATFDDVEAAWAAFRDRRQAHASGEGWAELATIDIAGHVEQLAWYGLHRAADPAESAPVSELPRRERAAHPAYLRAVTPS